MQWAACPDRHNGVCMCVCIYEHLGTANATTQADGSYNGIGENEKSVRKREIYSKKKKKARTDMCKTVFFFRRGYIGVT